MTRTLVIETAGNLWGSERALLDLLGAMDKTQVAVCCPPGRPLVAELEARGIRVLPHFVYALHLRSRWRRVQAVLGILRACAAFRPDVLYLNQSGAYRMALPAAVLFGLPMIAHIRIFEDAAYLAAQRPSPRRLRGIIAISSAIERHIRSFPALARIAVDKVYDAYAAKRLADGKPGASESRIACVGRLVPIKGQDILIGAMELLARKRPDVRCLIVGESHEDFAQQIQAQASQGPAAPNIEFSGFVHDILPLLRTTSVLVCPSHQEPLGRVIFEAWDAGALPVVFAGSGGAAEIVAAAAGGVLYDRQEPQDLAEALDLALNLAPEERQRLIDNGRAWMAENCDPATYGAAISRILSRPAGGGR